MRPELSRLNAIIGGGGLITPGLFKTLSTELLDERDKPEFEREWLRVHDELNRLTCGTEPPDVTAIRQTVYLDVFNLVAEPELAACVSDDFGLIASALAMQYSDPWLNGLWLSYKCGVFPGSQIMASSENIQATI
jgi:hypothetical protein